MPWIKQWNPDTGTDQWAFQEYDPYTGENRFTEVRNTDPNGNDINNARLFGSGRGAIDLANRAAKSLGISVDKWDQYAEGIIQRDNINGGKGWELGASDALVANMMLRELSFDPKYAAIFNGMTPAQLQQIRNSSGPSGQGFYDPSGQVWKSTSAAGEQRDQALRDFSAKDSGSTGQWLGALAPIAAFAGPSLVSNLFGGGGAAGLGQSALDTSLYTTGAAPNLTAEAMGYGANTGGLLPAGSTVNLGASGSLIPSGAASLHTGGGMDFSSLFGGDSGYSFSPADLGQINPNTGLDWQQLLEPAARTDISGGLIDLSNSANMLPSGGTSFMDYLMKSLGNDPLKTAKTALDVAKGATGTAKTLGATLPALFGPTGALSGMGDLSTSALGALLGAGSGLLGGGNKPAGTTTVVQDIPEWQKPYVQGNLNRAQTVVNGMGTNPVLPAAQAQYMKTINGDYLNPSSNPYLTDTYNAAAKSVTDNYLHTTQPQTDAYFNQAGAFGPQNSAWTETVARNQYGLGQNLQNLATNIYGGNYQNERNLQNVATGNAPAFATGSTQSQLAPYTAFGALAGQNFGQTQSTPYFTNPYANALGGALGGYALGGGKLFG